MTPDIRVQQSRFDPAVEAQQLARGGDGAIAAFTGQVRGAGGLEALELEHYPGMTEDALRAIAEEAIDRWSLSRLTVVHRYGRLDPGEPIVFVGAASAHRGDAIEAMHFVIDRLKTDAPVWKREIFEGGGAHWVEARASDDTARDKWRT